MKKKSISYPPVEYVTLPQFVKRARVLRPAPEKVPDKAREPVRCDVVAEFDRVRKLAG
jgi:hypothetical protein